VPVAKKRGKLTERDSMRMRLVSRVGIPGLVRQFGLAVFLVVLPVASQGQGDVAGPAARKNTLAERQRAIRELSDKDFAVREAATRFLWQCGLAAQPLLEQAVAGGDPEASIRAGSLLGRFAKKDVGKLPPDRAGRLSLYALEARRNPRVGVWKLFKEEPTEEELREFLLAIPDVPKRRQAVAALSAFPMHLLKLALARGPEPAESLLKAAAASGDPDAVRRWVAYLVVTNRAGKARDALEKQAVDGTLAKGRLPLLSALHYATGDHDQALELAEQIGYDDVKLSVAIKREDWITVGEQIATATTNEAAGLAVRSHAARLAGDDARADELLALVLTQGTSRAEVSHCYNLLLVEDRIDDMLKLLGMHGRGRDAQRRFLSALGRLEDARQIGRQPGNKKPQEAQPVSASQVVTEAQLQIAFDKVLKEKGLENPLLPYAIHNERQHGFHQLALRHSAQLVAAHRAADSKDERKIRAAIEAPFRPGVPAQRLFDAIEATAPETPLPAVMQRVSALLHFEGPLEPVRRLVAEGLESSLKPAGMSASNWYLMLAEVCWSRGLDKEAIECTKHTSGAGRSQLRLAQSMLPCLPEKQRIPFARWAAREALEWGTDSEIRTAVELLAVCDLLIPDDDSDMKALYPLLAVGRGGRGAYASGIVYHFRLLGSPGVGTATRLQHYRRIPGPDELWSMTQVFIEERRFAEALRESKFRELQLVSQSCVTDWDWGLPPIARHRRLQIAALLGLGKREEAKRLARSAEVWAIDGDDAILLHEILMGAGLKEEADHVFRAAYRALGGTEQGRGLPDRDLNNLAWLCAGCGEELEQARRYVEQAIKASPGEATCHDTLAHVLAAQGKLDAAIAMQRRAVALAPWGGDFGQDYRGSLREFIKRKAQQKQTKNR
jgi:tetratricopeptide (TPR) repeat protein